MEDTRRKQHRSGSGADCKQEGIRRNQDTRQRMERSETRRVRSKNPADRRGRRKGQPFVVEPPKQTKPAASTVPASRPMPMGSPRPASPAQTIRATERPAPSSTPYSRRIRFNSRSGIADCDLSAIFGYKTIPCRTVLRYANRIEPMQSHPRHNFFRLPLSEFGKSGYIRSRNKTHRARIPVLRNPSETALAIRIGATGK